jgi:hypothetical protein
VNYRIVPALACVALVLGGCSFQNKYEREAEGITRAVMANDLAPVEKDLAPGLHVTRVQIAAASDELSAQGKLLSIKEDATCPVVGAHCFTVKFEKHTYHEMLAMDDQGKVTAWKYKMADAP